MKMIYTKSIASPPEHDYGLLTVTVSCEEIGPPGEQYLVIKNRSGQLTIPLTTMGQLNYLIELLGEAAIAVLEHRIAKGVYIKESPPKEYPSSEDDHGVPL